MAEVAVVTDSTHYMPETLAREHGIREVSLYVNWGEAPQRELELGGYGDFYQRLSEGREFPTTSQPSIGDFLEVYEPLAQAGHDIFSVHLAGGISGTSQAAAQAAAMLREQGVAVRVQTMDSRTACGGLAGVALAAAAAARGGATLEEVAARAEQAREHLDTWFAVDTLEYLQRGGRIGRAQAWLGGALKVKPILTIGEEITPIERVRTAGRAVERMKDYQREMAGKGSDGWIVQHIQDPERAQVLVDNGRELFGCEPLFVSEVGPVIGAYIGPGLLGTGGLPRRLLEP